MRSRLSHALLTLGSALIVGCGGGGAVDDGGLLSGFTLTPVPAGFTRHVAPIIRDIPPGADVMYCQWIVAPADRELTIAGFAAQQSAHGHHVVLYANEATAPVGTSRECTSNDMLSVRYAGASAGEGTGAGFQLGDGVVFRVPKGAALMVNTHFINPTARPIDGQAVVDLRLAEPRADERVAGMFTNLDGTFTVAPNTQAAADTSCTLQQDLEIISFTNHMHEWGTSVYSELIRANGAKEPLLADATWTPERVFNPIFKTWPTTAPLLAKAGDTIHTHCEWDNTTPSDLAFPREMCVGIAFHLSGGNEIVCTNGFWEQ